MDGDIKISQVVLMWYSADARDTEDMLGQDESVYLCALNTSGVRQHGKWNLECSRLSHQPLRLFDNALWKRHFSSFYALCSYRDSAVQDLKSCGGDFEVLDLGRRGRYLSSGVN